MKLIGVAATVRCIGCHYSDLLSIRGLGKSGSLTAFRCSEEPGYLIVAGCWCGGLKAMRANLKAPKQHWPDASPADRKRYVAEYRSLIPLLESRIALWTQERKP